MSPFMVVSVKPENGFPAVLARKPEALDASTPLVVSKPEDELPSHIFRWTTAFDIYSAQSLRPHLHASLRGL